MKLRSQRFGTFPFPQAYDVVRVATLNKTDLGGGNNKFYVIEGHVAGSKYRLYSRYGRVGAAGTEEERIPPQDRMSLDEAFESLLREKTSARKGYVEVKLAATKVGSSVANKKILSDDIRKDKITVTSDGPRSPAVNVPAVTAALVDRLYAEAQQAVRSQLSGTLQTTAENPLGTLTLTQINEGRAILQKIQQRLAKKPSLIGSIATEILDLSNEFYSKIPQEMGKRPTSRQGKSAMDAWLASMALNNAQILDAKEDLLDLLSDVQGVASGFATSDIGKKIAEIGCQYTWLDPSDAARRRVADYMMSTRSRHHGWRSKVENVWRVSVRGQADKHVPTMKEVGNIKPLFHGSRAANILGICKHGLLMRPPGVYITGSMFGNGLYFADQSSKSEQYATARFGGAASRHGDTYFMFVADVALGKIKKYTSAQTGLTKPPVGYHSVQGEKGPSLLHNEFIVYDIKQHVLQYLVEFSTSGGYW